MYYPRSKHKALEMLSRWYPQDISKLKRLKLKQLQAICISQQKKRSL